jgi:hypothetical protein
MLRKIAFILLFSLGIKKSDRLEIVIIGGDGQEKKSIFRVNQVKLVLTLFYLQGLSQN